MYKHLNLSLRRQQKKQNSAYTHSYARRLCLCYVRFSEFERSFYVDNNILIDSFKILVSGVLLSLR